ncbi:hypothetical protein MTO96_007215 [Rhipicephalus appendiculatus]
MRFLALAVAVILAVTLCSNFSDAQGSGLKGIPYQRIRYYASQLALISSKSYARRVTEVMHVKRSGKHLAIIFEAVETTCKPNRMFLPSPSWCPVRKNGYVYHCMGAVELRGSSFQGAKFPRRVSCW